MPNRTDIVEAARSWIGTPWLHQGRTRRGIDCAGLVIVVGNNLGILNYDTNNYQRRTQGKGFLQHFRNNMQTKPIMEMEPGDVVLFRDATFPCHSTIVGERRGIKTIIHAHAARRKVIEELITQGDWCERYVACFNYIGIKE